MLSDIRTMKTIFALSIVEIGDFTFSRSCPELETCVHSRAGKFISRCTHRTDIERKHYFVLDTRASQSLVVCSRIVFYALGVAESRLLGNRSLGIIM